MAALIQAFLESQNKALINDSAERSSHQQYPRKIEVNESQINQMHVWPRRVSALHVHDHITDS